MKSFQVLAIIALIQLSIDHLSLSRIYICICLAWEFCIIFWLLICVFYYYYLENIFQSVKLGKIWIIYSSKYSFQKRIKFISLANLQYSFQVIWQRVICSHYLIQFYHNFVAFGMFPSTFRSCCGFYNFVNFVKSDLNFKHDTNMGHRIKASWFADAAVKIAFFRINIILSLIAV